jgi:hypothetical protein
MMQQQQSSHLRLVVDNTVPDPELDRLYEEYRRAVRLWHQYRPVDPQHPTRLKAFKALSAFWPKAAEPYGDGKTWGFN